MQVRPDNKESPVRLENALTRTCTRSGTDLRNTRLRASASPHNTDGNTVEEMVCCSVSRSINPSLTHTHRVMEYGLAPTGSTLVKHSFTPIR